MLEANPGLPRLHLGLRRRPSRPGTTRWSRRCGARGCRRSAASRSASSRRTQSRWLAFNQKELDLLNAAGDVPRRRCSTPTTGSSPSGRSRASRCSRRSIRTSRTRSSISATRWSAASARRRSRCAARSSWRYNLEEEIRVIRKHQAVAAQMPIPAGVVGHDPIVPQHQPVRPGARQQAARPLRLQARQGRLPHAARRQAAGAAATRRGTTAIEREFNELWKKSMDAIGIRMEFQIGKFADHLKAAKACQLMMWGAAWIGRLPRRRQLHAAPLRPEHRPEQQRLLRVEGVRRVLREVDAHARTRRSATCCSSR